MIIGVDPGDTTGIAIWRQPVKFGLVMLEQSYDQIMRSAWVIEDNTLVACERFVIGTGTAKKRRSTKALDVIGKIRGRCEEVGARFMLQGASDAKLFASDNLLKDFGWYRPGLGHANDAARHVTLALARELPWEFDKLLKKRSR